LPAYHNLTPKNKSFDEVSQWNRQEIKEISRNQLGFVTQSLPGGSTAERPISNHKIGCTLSLIKFYMYVRDASHEDSNLNNLEDAFRRFHTFEDVFLFSQQRKMAKAKVKALGTQLVKKRKVY
jgi:hypothetical protein